MKFEELRDLIVETLGCDADQVTPEASLTADLKADSLSLVELVMALEEATGLSIDGTQSFPGGDPNDQSGYHGSGDLL